MVSRSSVKLRIHQGAALHIFMELHMLFTPCQGAVSHAVCLSCGLSCVGPLLVQISSTTFFTSPIFSMGLLLQVHLSRSCVLVLTLAVSTDDKPSPHHHVLIGGGDQHPDTPHQEQILLRYIRSWSGFFTTTSLVASFGWLQELWLAGWLLSFIWLPARALSSCLQEHHLASWLATHDGMWLAGSLMDVLFSHIQGRGSLRAAGDCTHQQDLHHTSWSSSAHHPVHLHIFTPFMTSATSP